MLDVNTIVKSAYQNDEYLGDFIITIDGESATYTSADIKAGTLEIIESLCSGGSINFNAVEKEQLKATFGNLTQTKEELLGKKITVVQTVGGVSVPLGVFTIDDSQNDGDYFIKIVAYDNMVKFEKDVAVWWNQLVPFPITVRNLMISLFDHLELQYTLPDTFTNSNLLINRDTEFGNVTGSQMIGWIQETIGAFVKPDRYGRMRLVQLPSTSGWQTATPAVAYKTDAINRTTLLLSDMEIADYEVEPITGVKIRDMEDDVGVMYGSTDNVYIIQGNPFFSNLETTTGVPIAQAIFNKIRYLYYRPFRGTVKGLPYIECGDVVAVETLQGKYAIAPLLYRKLYSGGLYRDNIEVSGTEKHENVVTIQSSLKALNKTTHTVINTLETFQTTITTIGQNLDNAVVGQTYYWLVNDGETPAIDDSGWTTDSSIDWEVGKSKWQKLVTHYVGRDDSIRIVNLTEPNMIDIETWYYLSISDTEILDDYIYFTDHTFFSEKLYFTLRIGSQWVKNQKPEPVPGRYLWTRFKKIFSDGTEVWTGPIVDHDFNNAYTLIYQNSTSIEQTNASILLKADSSYVKEQYDALNNRIDQETSERHAEIAQTAQAINISVNQKVSAKPNKIEILRIAVDAGVIPTTDMEGWTTGTVVKGTGQHVWEIVKTTRIDVEDPAHEIVTYTGLADITGEKGEPGDNAAAVEVYDQKIRYAASNSGTVIPSSASSWKNDIASTGITAQQYLWTWTWIQWAHKNDLGNWVMDSDTNSYSVSYWSKDGEDGYVGADGRGIVSIVKKYKTSTSSTDPYASGYTYFNQDARFNTRSYFTELNHADDDWSDDIPEQFTPGRYLWTWTRTTWTDDTVTDEYTCDPSVAVSYDIYAYAEADIMVAEDNIRLWAHRTETLTTDFNTYKTETDSKIELMPNQILSQVSETYQTINGMSQYSTTTQMNSAIDQKAREITLSVSETYQTKSDAADQSESDREYTTTQLQNYPTKLELQSALQVTTNEISASVARQYATIVELSDLKNIAITEDVLYYLATNASSGVTRSTSGWSTDPQFVTQTKKYLWTYHKYVYGNENTTFTDPVITGVYGDKGAQGDTGVGITSVTPLYYVNATSATPTAPTSPVTRTDTGAGHWTKSIPAVTSTYKYIFTCDEILYTNGTYGWSTVVQNASLDDLYERITTAELKITDESIISTVTESDSFGNEVNSMIEQKANSIRMKADTITWESTYSSMSADGILTCSGANISGDMTITKDNYTANFGTFLIASGLDLIGGAIRFKEITSFAVAEGNYNYSIWPSSSNIVSSIYTNTMYYQDVVIGGYGEIKQGSGYKYNEDAILYRTYYKDTGVIQQCYNFVEGTDSYSNYYTFHVAPKWFYWGNGDTLEYDPSRVQYGNKGLLIDQESNVFKLNYGTGNIDMGGTGLSLKAGLGTTSSPEYSQFKLDSSGMTLRCGDDGTSAHTMQFTYTSSSDRSSFILKLKSGQTFTMTSQKTTLSYASQQYIEYDPTTNYRYQIKFTSSDYLEFSKNQFLLGYALDTGAKYYMKLHVAEYIVRFVDGESVTYSMVLNTNGLYHNGTRISSASSRRYKHDISYVLNRELDPHKLYDLKVAQFVFNDDHADISTKGNLIPGLIAEDVAKIYPAASMYNQLGQIESWDERIILPAMLQLIQEQKKEIDTLKEKLAEL